MAGSYFTHVSTRSDGPQTHVTHLTGVEIVDTAAGLFVYTSSGLGGGVTARALEDGLAPHDQQDFGTPTGLWAPTELLLTQLDGQQTLLLSGPYDDALSAYRVAEDGTLSPAYRLPVPTLGATIALAELTVGGTQMVFSSARQDWGVRAWADGGGDTLQPRGQVEVGGSRDSNDVFALAAVDVAGAPLLLAASAGASTLESFAITAQGSLIPRTVLALGADAARDGSSYGPGIAQPTTLATVTLPSGGTFALLGAHGSSSITVVAVAADGALTVTDQVIDSRETRFEGVSVLEVVEVEGRAYVIAGGSDDGLTLMELAPTGRLRHLETIADDTVMALTNPAAIDAVARDGQIELVAVGGSDSPEGLSGVTHLRLDPSPGDTAGVVRLAGEAGGSFAGGNGRDQIIGGAGADALFGQDGDDLLWDGAGRDTLTGGAGADTFVFLADGADDYVADFDPGADRLDVSALGLVRSMADITVIATATGAELRFAGESLFLESADGGSITADMLAETGLIDTLHHVPIAPPPLGDQDITGSAAADILRGSVGNDTLMGAGGEDRLEGGAGDDIIHAELCVDPFDAVSAQVFRLYQATLARAPDAGGHLGWTQLLLDDEIALSDAVTGFVASQEFQNIYGATDTTAFITLLYANVLGRAPDAAGLSGWQEALASGAWSREAVVLGFSESAEFRRATEIESLSYAWAAVQADWTDDVFRLYQATLARTPDMAGLEGWTTALANGADFVSVVAGFTRSREFQEIYGATDTAAFVTLLYANVLGRAPDADGFAHWTGILDSGALTREATVEGFSQSLEFRAATEDDVFTWVRAQGADDTILAGSGHNAAVGGIFADVFIIEQAAGGRLDIADTEPWDELHFKGFGYASVADIRAHLSQSGEDVIFADQGAVVVLHGVALADLEETLFVV